MKTNFKDFFNAIIRARIIASLTSVILLVGSTLTSSAQQTLVALSKETVPNNYNQSFLTPTDSFFIGSTGVWNVTSNSTVATIACAEPPYLAETKAIKFAHWSTATHPTATITAVSPIHDFSNPGCYSKFDISFDLYTDIVTAGDAQSFLALDFSSDGGLTWTPAWQRTAAQMHTSPGVKQVANYIMAIPNIYLTANFRYRFRSQMNAGNANTMFVYVDDIKLLNLTCGTLVNLGNLVWIDNNQNGIKDGAEQGEPNVNLTLTRDNDLDGVNDWDFTPKTTITDANGNYSFNGLPAGRYKVDLKSLNTNIRLTSINAGPPDEDGDNNNNGLQQAADFSAIDGGWITLIAATEPANDGDGTNGNLTYDFALYSAAALPAKSLEINLNVTAGKTTINWSTINEIHVKHFEVEKSFDNIRFEKIGTKLSIAVANGNATYSIIDATSNQAAKVIYYRIKTVDIDGRTGYSKTAILKHSDVDEISVWPNPFVSEIKITHISSAAERILVKITDNVGRIVKQQTFKCAAGVNQFTLTGVESFAPGLYTISAYNSATNTTLISKIIK
jgi:hypothetical protein